MLVYPKIETLFGRNEDFKVDGQRLRKPEFGLIDCWDVTEKVDGTNIRVDYIREYMINEGWKISFAGRSDKAQLPRPLETYLGSTFTQTRIDQAVEGHTPSSVTLYGEGYGAGIQKGGVYRQDQSFILFDVLIEDTWWLNTEQVKQFGEKAGVEVVPMLHQDAPTHDVVSMVANGLTSNLSDTTAEGVVCKPRVNLYNGRGERVIWKLKTRDFAGCKR